MIKTNPIRTDQKQETPAATIRPGNANTGSTDSTGNTGSIDCNLLSFFEVLILAARQGWRYPYQFETIGQDEGQDEG
jgi:hypothetical protein